MTARRLDQHKTIITNGGYVKEAMMTTGRHQESKAFATRRTRW